MVVHDTYLLGYLSCPTQGDQIAFFHQEKHHKVNIIAFCACRYDSFASSTRSIFRRRSPRRVQESERMIASSWLFGTIVTALSVLSSAPLTFPTAERVRARKYHASLSSALIEKALE